MTHSFLSSSLLIVVLAFSWSAGAQNADFGDLPQSAYSTKLPNGARHAVSEDLFLGSSGPDYEADGFEHPTAGGDDSNGVDDEDAVNPGLILITPGLPYDLKVKATNLIGAPAVLRGFMDWNHDGDFLDADEVVSKVVPDGSVDAVVRLSYNVPASAVTTGFTALRLRLSTDAVLGADGAAQNGEVEDFFIQVQPQGTLKDYGDLPDAAPGTAAGAFYTGTVPDYKTMAADGGPSHVLRPGLFFANNTGSGDAPIDAETDGQPSLLADGDDVKGSDDELGMTLTSSTATFMPDGTASWFMMDQTLSVAVANVTGSVARVAAFLDVNSDGDFDDVDEQAPVILVPGDGSVTSVAPHFLYKVTGFAPAVSFSRSFAMRFRITTDATLGSTGAATDGEVMDAVQTVQLSVPPNGYDPLDFGDLPAPYPTLRAVNGARHVPTQAIFLGTAMPDGEPDGAPSMNADGDDVNAADDENAINAGAVSAVRGFSMSLPVKATNNMGSGATLSGFIDWNHDSDFLDAGESATKAVPNGSIAATFALPWTVPVSAATGATAVRLRLATGAALPAIGVAADGEVEDFFINVSAQGIDYGDLPDSGAGTAAGSFSGGPVPDYQTRAADGGPSHVMKQGLYFTNDTGSADAHVDAEADGQPSAAATGDNLNGDNDELGLLAAISRLTLKPDGTHSTVEVELTSSLAVTNTTGTAAEVRGFIDANEDGDFNDPGEQAPVISVPGDGSMTAVTPVFTFEIGNLTGSPMTVTRALRFRISTDTGLSATGAATDGEVHDQLLTFTLSYNDPDPQHSMDYGDLPAVDYPTLWAQNGARHVVGQTLFMGNAVPDGEPEGHSSASADGDDVASSDDEDGFNPSSVLAVPGAPVDLPVKCSNAKAVAAILHGYVDWNDDGDFQDVAEQATAVVPAGSAGVMFPLSFNVPAGTPTTKPVAVRLRLSTDAGLGPLGYASDGEVEDYFMEVSQGMDFGDLPAGAYATRLADNGPRHASTPHLYLGSGAPDLESNGTTNVTATGDDLNGVDDEDAIDPTSLLLAKGFLLHLPVTLMNNTGTGATLSAFIDWNGDGDFLDLNESTTVAVPTLSTSQTVTADFTVPVTADSSKPVGVRLRLAFAAVPAIGMISSGEVEDFMLSVPEESLDYGDLPDAVSGTASGAHGTASPPDYQTRLADDGARHVLRPGLYFARDVMPQVDLFHVDPEPDGLASNAADGDDNNNEDDEWTVYHAVTSTSAVVDGVHSTMTVDMIVNHCVTNTTGSPAWMYGFMDLNSDGDFADAGEQSAPALVPTGTLCVAMNIPFTFTVSLNATPPLTYNVAVRSRITTDSTCGPNGLASDGEVQDDLIGFSLTWEANGTRMDYGDLNGTRYPTMWADNGARHVIKDEIYIGSAPPDEDTDGHASVAATGDDVDATDDEEGFNAAAVHPYVNFPVNFPVRVTNTTGAPAELYSFVDWNDDGDFSDTGETSTIAVPTGTAGVVMNLPWNVPSTASTSAPVAVRLRLSTDKGLTHMGRATDGEVEDCLITVTKLWDFGDLPDFASGTSPGVLNALSTVSQGDYRTTLADNGPRHVMRPDLSIVDDLNPSAIHVDQDADGHPSAGADGDDLADSDDEQSALFAIVRQIVMPTSQTTANVKLVIMGSVAIKNETGSYAYLTPFMDANNDGDFDDAGEKGVYDTNYDGDTLDAGESNTITVASVPGYQVVAFTFSPMWQLTKPITGFTATMPVRIRISTASGLTADGAAPDGEVEDYMLGAQMSSSTWWDTPNDGPDVPDYTIDIGLPGPLGGNSLPSVLASSIDTKWTIGGVTLTGNAPVMGTSTLSNLGTGLHSYTVTGRSDPYHVSAHTGVIKIGNYNQFRAFMGEHSVTNQTAAPDGDADGDGVSNFAEFALGTNPTSDNAPPHFEPKTVNEGPGSNYFTLPYLRRSGGTENGAMYQTSDATYVPLASQDLQTWTRPLVHVTPPSGLPTPPSGYEWGAVRIPTAMSGGQQGFIQLQVVAP